MPSNSKASVSVVIGADLGKSFKGAFGSANKQLTKLGSAIKKTSQRANQIEAFRKSSRATKEAGIAYKQARQNLNLLSREVKSSIVPSKTLQNNFRKSQRLADRAKKSFVDTARSTRQMGKALRASGVDMRNFNKEQGRLSKKLKGLQSRQSSVIKRQDAKDANLQNRSNKRSQMFDAVALGGALFSVVKPAVDFELAMAKVGAITDEAADGEGFKKLTKQARELGRTTQFTASQSAEAMQFLGMAGLSTNEILEATPSVLNLAVAGNMDLGRVADITSNILTGFNMEANETAKVADILAQASRSTNVNVEMLGQTMKFIAPAAAAMGGTLEETTVLAGVLGNAGIQATMAGTMLRSAYLRLAAPAKKGAEALGEMRDKYGLTADEMPDVAKQSQLAQKRLTSLNVEVFSKTGKMRSMIDILKDMSVALKDASDQEKISAVKDIFGTRSSAGALTIFESIETKDLDGIAEKIKNADGAAKEMADRLRNTTFGAWKRFSSAIESVGISIGSVLLPSFADVLGVLASGATAISTFAEQNTVLTKIIGITVASLVTLKVVAITTGYAFTFLKGVYLTLGGVVSKVVTVFKWMNMVMLLNPVGLIIGAIALAIAGVAAAAYFLVDDWKPVGKFFKDLFGNVVSWVKTAFEWVSKLLNPLKKVTNLAGKAVNFVFGDDEEEEDKNKDPNRKPVVGNVVRTFERENVETPNQQQFLTENNNQKLLTTNNNISRIAGNNTRSNISITSPITINSTGNNDEKKIADQVKLALDESFRQFDVRKQALNYD